MTGPSVSAAARSAGSKPSIRPVTAARPDSTARHWAGVTRRASPAAVVDARPGTGVSCWPAASARWRSSPVRKSSPASCAAAIPHSSSPAPKPRSRCLIGPTAASSSSATPSRSHNSVTAARPAFAVSDASGRRPAPADAACCHHVCCAPDRCPLRWADNHLAAIIIPGQSGTYRHLPGRVTGLLAELGLNEASADSVGQ